MLADRLKKTIGEIERMSLDEFAEWIAYLKTIDVGAPDAV